MRKESTEIGETYAEKASEQGRRKQLYGNTEGRINSMKNQKWKPQ